MNPLLTSVMAGLHASGGAIDALAAGATPEVASQPPGPGRWSINEVLGHLAEEERNDFRMRVDYTLHRAGEAWPSFDPQRTVREGRFNEQTLDALRTDFLLERQKSLTWLAGLHDADWAASYDHPKLGRFTAASLLCAWAAHDLLHLRQIDRILFERLAQATQPDRTDYAGEW